MDSKVRARERGAGRGHTMARREMTGLHTARESMCLSLRNLKPNSFLVKALTLHRAHSHWLALATGVLSHTHNSNGISIVF